MTLLFLHGNGWDDLALMGVAILIAFLVVSFTMRRRESVDDTASENDPAAVGDPPLPGEPGPNP